MYLKQQYRCKTLVFTAFAFLQMLLLGYLLTIDFVSAILFGVVFGIPVSFLCQSILQSQLSLNTRSAIAMTAVGGFGMLLACLLEIGPLGLNGLVDMCQAISSNSSLFSLDWVWKRFMLTPWTYMGMVMGCNLGMWLLDNPENSRTESNLKRFMLYGSCNVGMFLGMFLFEHIAMSLTVYTNFSNSPLLMVSMMLSGMLFGMLLFLSIASRTLELNRWPEIHSGCQNQV